ncbi:golgin subfamily A member 4 isoform X1 [Esox lucius]|uniref:GRIP domain-containing protein n=1 Tax=Esox lucius TaxID=8010 RepID=A0A3P8Y591_ESOLU|nr:golgin subfamily A member 4 isoform X1 [Esox lucius]
MFKKLKQKINEEQSPQRNAQSPQQAQVGPGERRSSHTFSSPQQDVSASPSDREVLAGMIAEPAFLSEYTIFALDQSKRPPRAPQVAQVASAGGRRASGSPGGSINGDGRASPQREEPQSLAQKLQLRVPSVESLFRGATRAEGLFRSPSKESLNRSPSLNSLTPPGENEALAAPSSPSAIPSTPAYDPPSDIESEAEDLYGSPEPLSAMSKDQLIHRLHRVEGSLGKYRGKYSELVTTYRTVQRDKEKTQAILSQSQDKALRRIGELREELQMDQQAKKHLQEEFDAALEEKDQMITVLQTQVALMKKRVQEASGGAVAPEVEHPLQAKDAPDSASVLQSPSDDTAEGNDDPSKTMEVLQKRVTRQENLLQKCKELLRTHKERCAQLTSENDALQEQLQERLQELEKTKELHTTEKTKLITQLRDAKNLIEQLEQDKGMVIAETKRQMHETLEMKEEEIAQLRSRNKLVATQKEELQEQKEKSEKAAFEELEKALAMAQRAEEARRLLQLQLEEQMKEVERAGEEERKSLQQELSRVKQEVVTIMKKTSEEKMSEMEKLHSEALAIKEEELNTRISQAVEQCKEELGHSAKEREQQFALALEDAELQKAAIEKEAETNSKKIRLDLEAARTRILELESSLEQHSQSGSVPTTDDLSTQMEELRRKHKEEMATLEGKHCEELENCKTELEKHKVELHSEALAQHNAAMEELRAKHRAGVETIMKEKEVQFHAHVEDMNEKMMEKLDVKQTELEALSSELQEVLRSKQILEERLDAVENAGRSARQELEQRLQEVLTKHSVDIEEIKQHHESSLGGMEKTLKEELNKLTMVLKEKEKDLEAHLVCEKSLKEEAEALLQDRNAKLTELEELRKSLKQAQSEKKGLEKSNAHLSKIRDELSCCKNQLNDLVQKLETTQSDCLQKEHSLQQKIMELHELDKQLQQVKNELSEQEKSYTKELNTKQEEEKQLKKQLEDQKAAHEKKLENVKKDMETKLKSQEAKMEKFKTKTKEMQEKFKKKLQEQEESLKKELAYKEAELKQKEQQVKDKILESQTSSEGLSSAMSQLEANHKEELEKMCEVHKQEKEKLKSHWQEKLAQHEEEMQEKHLQILQEKLQEVEDITQQLQTIKDEKEQVLQEVNDLKEELVMRQTTVQKLQAELKEAAVKLESLSQTEAMFKEQVEAVERNLNTALNERNSFQDQLNKTEENAKEKLKVLSEKVVDTEKQLQALEASKGKEGEAVQRRLEEHSLQLEVKEKELQKQFAGISNELVSYCQAIEASIESGTKELSERVDNRVGELKDRLLCNQKKVAHLKNIILTSVDKIHSLEGQLQERTEENKSLCSSLDQLTFQLNVHKDDIKALTAERESLQKDAENHSQALSEKVICIEQLSEENRTLLENIKTNVVDISHLDSIINDLKTQLSGSLAGKDQAISLLEQQHKEERKVLVFQMEETINKLEKEKLSAVKQADTLKNELIELKREAEFRFSQNHNTVKSLQTCLEDMEKQVSEKDEALQRLADSIGNQSISKSEIDQALSEKEQKVSALTLEVENCNHRLSELEQQLVLRTKECEQLTADLKQQDCIREREKQELTDHLQQTQEQFRAQSGDLLQTTQEKLQTLERQNLTLTQELERQKDVYEKTKSEILKSNEENLKTVEERLLKDNAGKVAELKKKAEQKISQIRKHLTSQLEAKENIIRTFQTKLEEAEVDKVTKMQQIETLEKKGKSLEEAMAKMNEEQEKHLEQVHSDERLEKESSLQSLQDMYEEKISSLQKNISNQEEALAKLKEKNEKYLEQVQNDNRIDKESSVEGLKNMYEEKLLLLHKDISNQEETIAKLKEAQEKHVEQVRNNERLDKESCLESLKNMYEEKLLLLQRDVSSQDESKADNTLSRLEEVKAKLKEMEEERVNILSEISSLKEDLLEKAALIEQQNTVIDGFKKPGQTTSEVMEHCTAKQTKSLAAGREMENSLTQEDGDAESLLSLQNKLGEAVQEKQKLQKDFNRLQKDLRSLRREHEQDLEYVKKELAQENEKKLKLEVEDLEMKHNSSLKQLMREFNTQMALKEQELSAAVKEAIEKAQSVEVELIDSHQEETSQLHKVIAQKDDDLNRTVQRYEQVLQSREEEMGARVWQVQKELEDLQAKTLSNSGEMSAEELQVLLAEKTTLLSEARLKEQHYVDRIHSLEDKMRCVHKNSVVTHLGNKFKDPGHYTAECFSEPTEFEYLRKVLFEYMMGRETKTMAKVITSILKFPPDQTQQVLEKEDAGVYSFWP